MSLSRLYNQNKWRIEKLLVDHILENPPSETARMFGLSRAEVAERKSKLRYPVRRLTVVPEQPKE